MLIGIDASRATAAQKTGTETYSWHLIQAMVSGSDQHRWRLYFNTPPAPGFLAASSRVEKRVIPFPRLWSHWRLARELYRDRPDVLFVPSHVLPILFPGPAVVTVHDLGFRHFPQAHATTSRLYLELTTRWHTRRATRIVADSEATRRDLIAHYQADADRIVVAYPGYDDTLRPVQDPVQLAAARERANITAKHYLLFIGTLQPRKNLVRLIDAFARLDRSDTQLVLAGKPGWLAEPILARARHANVLLPGFIPEADKAALLSGATAFVFPSLYEGFGFPVLEAMACGTPVICSNTSSLPEIAGDAAVQVDPMNVDELTRAIERLLVDRELQDRLVERGHTNLHRFSWARCATQVLQAIEETL